MLYRGPAVSNPRPIFLRFRILFSVQEANLKELCQQLSLSLPFLFGLMKGGPTADQRREESESTSLGSFLMKAAVFCNYVWILTVSDEELTSLPSFMLNKGGWWGRSETLRS